MSSNSHRFAMQIRVRLTLLKYGYGPWTVAVMSDEEVLRAYLWVFAVQTHRLGQAITEFGLQAKVFAGSLARLREALR